MGADKNSSPKRELGLDPKFTTKDFHTSFQGHVVMTDVPTLGTNPKRSQSGSTNQEAKDLAVRQQSRRTVRGPGANCPRPPRGRSAPHGGRSVKH
jgi:hypothetical protein